MAEHDDHRAGKRRSGGTPPAERTDRSPWNWLLLVPLAAVLIPPFYNRLTPELFGVPFFYWYQLAAVFIGVACTVVVYRKTRG